MEGENRSRRPLSTSLSAMENRIDHLMYAAADMNQESDRLASEIGVRPKAGGRHEALGTVNALLPLGERMYLEVIGPDPDISTTSPMAKRCAELPAPDLLTFAVERSDLEAVDAKARALGLGSSGIVPSSRRTANGELLEWRLLFLGSKAFAGLIPFFIDWQDSPHPSEGGPEGAELAQLVLTHPDAEALRKLQAELEVEVDVRFGNRAAIIAELEGAEGGVLLVGSGKGL